MESHGKNAVGAQSRRRYVLGSKLPLFPYGRGWETQPNSRGLYTHEIMIPSLKVRGFPSATWGVDRPDRTYKFPIFFHNRSATGLHRKFREEIHSEIGDFGEQV